MSSYEGSTDEAGLFHGLGTAMYTSGERYEGTFVHGKMHGRGKMTFPDGIEYEGDFEDNNINGQGVRASSAFLVHARCGGVEDTDDLTVGGGWGGLPDTVMLCSSRCSRCKLMHGTKVHAVHLEKKARHAAYASCVVHRFALVSIAAQIAHFLNGRLSS